MKTPKTPHKHAELIKAWADGALIQCIDAQGHWFDVLHNEPSWNATYEYRIKPEPKPDFHVTYIVTKDAPLWIDQEFKRAHICTKGNLLLTFDGETSELKAAEVLK